MYGTLVAADAYHAARGNAAWEALADPAKTIALVRGTDYIDQMYRVRLKSGRWVPYFSGYKTASSQANEFPRNALVDYEGNEWPDSSTPEAIEHATYEAALREAANPGSLMPDYTPTETLGVVTQETVGPVTVKYDGMSGLTKGYENRPPNMPIITKIETLVAPFLKAVATSYTSGVRTV